MMPPTLDLHPDAILLDHPATALAGVLDDAAEALAARRGLEREAIRRELGRATSEAPVAVGAGVAVPHIPVAELSRCAVCLVRTATPIALGALDGIAVDVFFVVLYPAGDPSGHLRFLAHLAGLCRSRPFRNGLRGASAAGEVRDLVSAAESRVRGAPPAPPPVASPRGLAMIAVSGERTADTIMMGLLREGLAAATIVDAQTLRDAASRELPLFAGFRDLFGDPDGRRLIFAHVELERAGALAAIVEQACHDERSAAAELVVVPVAGRWAWPPRDAP